MSAHEYCEYNCGGTDCDAPEAPLKQHVYSNAVLYATQEDLRTTILNYEVSSSWWAGWIGGDYAQEVTAKYFAWKVNRKFNAYLKSMRYREKHELTGSV